MYEHCVHDWVQWIIVCWKLSFQKSIKHKIQFLGNIYIHVWRYEKLKLASQLKSILRPLQWHNYMHTISTQLPAPELYYPMKFPFWYPKFIKTLHTGRVVGQNLTRNDPEPGLTNTRWWQKKSVWSPLLFCRIYIWRHTNWEHFLTCSKFWMI